MIWLTVVRTGLLWRGTTSEIWVRTLPSNGVTAVNKTKIKKERPAQMSKTQNVNYVL